MTQEQIFRYVGTAGTSGGFAVGKALPKEKGNLKGFKIVRMPAIEGEDYAKFERRLIEKLGEMPKRGAEIRVKQLRVLIEKYADKGKIFIIIISKAHLLSQKTLHCMKGLHEIGTMENIYPGIVFLGDVVKINDMLKKEKSIQLRTSPIPA